MRSPSIILALAATATVLAACSIREGRIAVPSQLAEEAERLELRGMGGGRSGGFDLAGNRGLFTRRADRLGIFDPLFVGHRGGGSFTIAGPATGRALAGRCAYREAKVDVGPFSLTPQRLAYRCEFARDGRPIEAELVIEDPQSAFGTLHGRSERRGMLWFEGQRITVRSIHRDQGGGLPVPHPLGYMFEADGGEIGAVDLNGANKTLYVPRSEPQREAVIAAALALAILWDPAEVQPDS